MDGNTFFFGFEPEFMMWLQECFGEAGRIVAGIFTFFGEDLFLIAILGFIYWCLDKRIGKIIGVNIVTAVCLNPLLKNIALRKRPYMVHDNIKCLKAPEASGDIYDVNLQGYSFPSGHSMNSACVYGTMPFVLKHRIFKIVAFVLPLIVGFSRVLLGVHYPTDVLCGWAAGALIGVGLTLLQRRIRRKEILYLVLFLVSATGVFFCKTDDYFTSLGVMAGLFPAFIFEEKVVNFDNTRRVPYCILRVVGGFAVYFIVNLTLKALFSIPALNFCDTATRLLRSLRYAVIVFTAIGVYPMAFGVFEGFCDRILLKKMTEVDKT